MRRNAFSWSALAVLVLAALAAVLVVAALRGPAGGAGAVPGPTGSVLTDPLTVSQEPETANDGSDPDVEPPLDLVDGRSAYRGTAGSCQGASTLERTTDGGVSWEPLESPVAAVSDLDAKTSVVVTVVGGDESCQLGSWTTLSAGRDWNATGSTAGLWIRPPGTTRTLQTPAGIGPSPCPDPSLPVREIEGLDGLYGYLVCQNGAVFGSADGGATWTKQSVVTGAVALSWETTTDGSLLQQGGDACPGLQLLRSTNNGIDWDRGGCVGGAAVAADREFAPSLDFVDVNVGMALVGGSTFVTTDGGESWREPAP